MTLPWLLWTSYGCASKCIGWNQKKGTLEASWSSTCSLFFGSVQEGTVRTHSPGTQALISTHFADNLEFALCRWLQNFTVETLNKALNNWRHRYHSLPNTLEALSTFIANRASEDVSRNKRNSWGSYVCQPLWGTRRIPLLLPRTHWRQKPPSTESWTSGPTKKLETWNVRVKTKSLPAFKRCCWVCTQFSTVSSFQA